MGAVPAGAATACTDSWTNPAGGAYETASNWSTGKVPGSADMVCIELSGTYTVSVSAGGFIGGLSIGTTTTGGTQTLSIRNGGGNTGIVASGGIANGPRGAVILDGGNGEVSFDARASTLQNAGTITTTSTSPTAAAGRATISGNLTNLGALQIEASANYAAGTGPSTTLDNRGTVALSGGAALATTGAGPVLVVNDTGGQINAVGDGSFRQGLGTFQQGGGTTSGATPVILTGYGNLSYTGSGASHIEIQGGTNLSGTLSPEQSLRIFSAANNTGASAPGGFTNQGTVVLDASHGTVGLDVAGSTLTNSGTLDLDGGGAAGSANLTGTLVNTGSLQVTANAHYGSGTGPSTTFTQGAGSTSIAAGATFDTGPVLTFAGGTLAGAGTITGSVINSGARVVPGPGAGTLTLGGNFTQGSAGTLVSAVGGTGAGQFAQLAVAGVASLGGTLALAPSAGYASVAAPGARTPVLVFGVSRSGTFAAVASTPPLAGCKAYSVAYDDPGKRVEAVVGNPGSCRGTAQPLALTQVRLAPSRFTEKRGATLLITLTRAATLTAQVTQTSRGRRVGRGCEIHANRGRRCTTTVTRGRLTWHAIAGANKLRFRLTSLRAGRYSVTLVARDRAGHRSKSVKLTFTITKR